MRVQQALVASLIGAVCGCAAPSPSEEGGPLEGAWRLTGLVDVAADGTRTDFTPQESLFLFRGDHYSMAYAFGDQRSPASPSKV